MTFHGKTYINTFLFNGSKRLIVICFPLKRFGKSLEALERPLIFSLQPFIALEKSLKTLSQSVKSVRKKRSNFPSMAFKDLESV